MIELNALSNALLVLEVGSFRGAAAQLGVRPSVVSRRVQRLEDRLGMKLFYRRSQGAQPTLAGANLLASAKLLLTDLDQLLRSADRSGATSDGALKIGVIGSIAGGTIRRLFERLLRDHPRLDLDIVEGLQSDHIAAVQALRLDAAVILGEASVTNCGTEALWLDRLLVALPAAHPLAELAVLEVESIAHERFMVSRSDYSPNIIDYVVASLERRGHHPEITVRSVRREGLMALVGLGRGVTFVCEAGAAVAYPGVVYRPLVGEVVPLSVVWSRQNDNRLLTSFLSLARAQTRQLEVQSAVLVTTDEISQNRDPSP